MKTKSFTLIEMVVVIGVIGFVLPILFSIIFLIIRQQTRIYSLQELKKQGDNAFYSMQTSIRENGVNIIANPTIITPPPYPTIYDICPIYPSPTLTPAPNIYLYDKSGAIFSYSVVGNKIASNSAKSGITNYYLTNDKTKIASPGADFLFSCYRSNQFSPSVVWTYFKITQNSPDTNPSSMDYSTKFQLKNY